MRVSSDRPVMDPSSVNCPLVRTSSRLLEYASGISARKFLKSELGVRKSRSISWPSSTSPTWPGIFWTGRQSRGSGSRKRSARADDASPTAAPASGRCGPMQTKPPTSASSPNIETRRRSSALSASDRSSTLPSVSSFTPSIVPDGGRGSPRRPPVRPSTTPSTSWVWTRSEPPPTHPTWRPSRCLSGWG